MKYTHLILDDKIIRETFQISMPFFKYTTNLLMLHKVLALCELLSI